MAEHTPRGPKGVKAPKALPQKPKRGKKPQEELEELREHLPSVPRAPLAKSLTAAQRKMLLKGAKGKTSTTATGGTPEEPGIYIPTPGFPKLLNIIVANQQAVIAQLNDYGYEDWSTAYDLVINTLTDLYGEQITYQAIQEIDFPEFTWTELVYYPEEVSNKMAKYLSELINWIQDKAIKADEALGPDPNNPVDHELVRNMLDDALQTAIDSYADDGVIHLPKSGETPRSGSFRGGFHE